MTEGLGEVIGTRRPHRGRIIAQILMADGKRCGGVKYIGRGVRGERAGWVSAC